MFKQIDNTPNIYLYSDIAPSLGTTTPNQPKPRSGCTDKVSSFSETQRPITSTTIVDNGKYGYDTLSSSDLYASAFDEFGPPDVNDTESDLLVDNEKPVDPNEYKVNLITHIYVGSLSIIGLFALYRMIQKTR
jgi:hypothetical protein